MYIYMYIYIYICIFEGYISQRKFIMCNWFMQLWRLRSSMICYLYLKVKWYNSLWAWVLENQGSQWCKPKAKTQSRWDKMTHLMQASQKQRVNSREPQWTGWHSPIMEGQSVLQSPLIQLLISSAKPLTDTSRNNVKPGYSVVRQVDTELPAPAQYHHHNIMLTILLQNREH
jgi:hypothetical protein